MDRQMDRQTAVCVIDPSHQTAVHQDSNEDSNNHYQEGAAPLKVMYVQGGDGGYQAFWKIRRNFDRLWYL